MKYETKQKSNKKMMILSVFGIIFVVLGHTGNAINLMSNFFTYYSFHLALFFFISGYFYKQENEDNLYGKKGYIWKQTKKLVIPYFIWNLIYGIIGMILRKCNIIEYGHDITLKNFILDPWLGGHQYIINLAAWFMLALFLVKIIYIVTRKILNNCKIWNDDILIIIFFIIAWISIYIAKKYSNINYIIPFVRTGFFLFFYHFGYYYKKKIENKIHINTYIYLAIIILIQFIILKLDSKIAYLAWNMTFNSKYIITNILASLTGILFWLKISEIVEPILGKDKIINYIGNNTSDIMIHHLFWCLLFNIIIFYISRFINLNSFDAEKFKTTIYYQYSAGVGAINSIYTIIGIAMPLFAKYNFEKIQARIAKYKDKKLK